MLGVGDDDSSRRWGWYRTTVAGSQAEEGNWQMTEGKWKEERGKHVYGPHWREEGYQIFLSYEKENPKIHVMSND